MKIFTHNFKNYFSVNCLIILISVLLFGFGNWVEEKPSAPHNYIPPNGVVADSATAIEIGKIILSKIYGKESIKKQEPFNAELKNGVWIIDGSLPEVRGKIVLGGVALIEISKKDCRVLRISHGK